MITAYEAYTWNLSIKVHFSSPKFSIIKYKNKGLKFKSPEEFYRTNERYLYSKIIDKCPSTAKIIQYFAASRIFSNEELLYDVESGFQCYNKLRHQKESLGYILEQDLLKINECMRKCKLSSFKELISLENTIPQLMKMYLCEDITFITMLCLFNTYNLENAWSVINKIYRKDVDKLIKANVFFKLDEQKIKRIINETLDYN
jgi:hypothetical protein